LEKGGGEMSERIDALKRIFELESQLARFQDENRELCQGLETQIEINLTLNEQVRAADELAERIRDIGHELNMPNPSILTMKGIVKQALAAYEKVRKL
jgi:hypothetical protein